MCNVCAWQTHFQYNSFGLSLTLGVPLKCALCADKMTVTKLNRIFLGLSRFIHSSCALPLRIVIISAWLQADQTKIHHVRRLHFAFVCCALVQPKWQHDAMHSESECSVCIERIQYI